MNREKVIEYFKNKFKSPSTLMKRIRQMDDQMKQFCEQELKKQPKYQNISKMICAWVNDIELRKCEYCGQYLTYEQTKRGKRYCCKQHVQLDQKIRKKIQNTCLQKYGTKCPTLNQQVLNKRKENNIKKYGYENTLSVPQIRQKIKNTCRIKYGGNAPSCAKHIHLKMNQTFKQKFNCDHNQLIKGYQHILTFNQFVIPLFTISQYYGMNNHIYKWKCVKCEKDFQSEFPYDSFNELPDRCPRCPNCYPSNNGISNQQKQVLEYIKEIYIGQIKQNDKEIIKPLELDIILPELKLAIQFNGTYWHSDCYKEYNYHLNKTNMCQKAGYRLIHIFQWQWQNKQQIIKQKLKSIICKDIKSIYGRKCQIKQISSKQKNDFLNKYHIQGQDKSNVNIGLFYQNQLIAVMTFCKPRFNKNYEYELSRYATKYRVIGGASKLLKYFQKHYNPKSIITYADRRFSIGNLYNKLGFKLLNVSKPNYFWTKQKTILTRYQCQKHKLKQLLGQQNYDQKLTQNQNMKLNGWNKIFDCGNYVFIK